MRHTAYVDSVAKLLVAPLGLCDTKYLERSSMRLRSLLLAVLILPSATLAEEGMWLPSQTGAIGPAMRDAGLQLDPAKCRRSLQSHHSAVVRQHS